MKLFFKTLLVLLIFFAFSGCMSQDPDILDPNTGYLQASYKLKPTDIMINKPINIKEYDVVILTGLAQSNYAYYTLKNMKIFKLILTPDMIARMIHLRNMPLEEVAENLDTEYGPKVFANITHKKTLNFNIESGQGEFILTVTDPTTNKIYFQAKKPAMLMSPKENIYKPLFNAVLDWLHNQSQN